MTDWRLNIVKASGIEEKPWRMDAVKAVDWNEDEVDLTFDGSSPGYVITVPRADISEWLDTLVHISRKTWFTTDHARSFALVMMERARYPR